MPSNRGFCAETGDDLVGIHILAAGKIVRLRVVTAGTGVRTALRKNGKAKARAVYDGIVDQAGDAECSCSFLLCRAFPGQRAGRKGDLQVEAAGGGVYVEHFAAK